LLPQNALKGKTVLPIVSGGAPGHQLVLEYALKPVLSVLGAEHILQGVYVLDKQVLQYGDDVPLKVAPELEDRLRRAIADVAGLFTQPEPIPA
jgi:FMN reductase